MWAWEMLTAKNWSIHCINIFESVPSTCYVYQEDKVSWAKFNVALHMFGRSLQWFPASSCSRSPMAYGRKQGDRFSENPTHKSTQLREEQKYQL